MSDKLAAALSEADHEHFGDSPENYFGALAAVAREFIAEEHAYIDECPWCAGYRVGKADND